MYTYAYQARDNHGKILSGIQDALNEENAINSPDEPRAHGADHRPEGAASKRKKSTSVKETDLVLFTRQLATMIDAGIPLVGATTALYETADPKKQAGLRNVVGDITGARARRRELPPGADEASERFQPVVHLDGQGG